MIVEAFPLRTLDLMGSALLAAILLAACGRPDDTVREDVTASAVETASVSVALSFRERLALSGEAVAEAELVTRHDGADEPAVIAMAREAFDGRQVPLTLTIEYAPSEVPSNAELAVVGRIIDPVTGHVWVMPQDATFSAANRTAELGMIMLERSGHGAGGPRSFTCADGTVLTVTWLDPDLEIEWREETHTLSPVIAASGARFETGERDSDDWRMFWSRGQHAMLGLPLQDPLSCEADPMPAEPQPEEAAIEAEAPVYTASGNEPGWLLRLSGDTAEYLGNYGEVRVSGTVSAREALEEDVTRLTVEAADAITLVAEIAARRCSDTMTGLTYPDTVAVILGETRYTGCGGDAESLLTGGAWSVTHIAGEEVPGPRAVTLEFDGEGRVAGQGPCNRYSAAYQMTGEGLVLSQGVSTRMACVSEIMALETTFLDILQGSLTVHIHEDGVLNLGEGRILAVRE